MGKNRTKHIGWVAGELACILIGLGVSLLAYNGVHGGLAGLLLAIGIFVACTTVLASWFHRDTSHSDIYGD